jgi:hypothetical protein
LERTACEANYQVGYPDDNGLLLGMTETILTVMLVEIGKGVNLIDSELVN